MKKVFIALTLVLFSFSSFANNTYTVNDADLDLAFAKAETVSIMNSDIVELSMTAAPEPKMLSFGEGEKNVWIAWVLTNSGYIGICGVHRLYLGTSIGTFVGYLLTLGGCGIVQTIDWVVLLIDAVSEKDITKYVNNTKFFMW